MRKRFTVGFMVLAWYVLPMYLCPISLVLVNTQLGLMVCYEAFNVRRQAFEDSWLNKLFCHTTVIAAYFIYLPSIGVLDRHIVEASGWKAETHPLLFMILYDCHKQISFALVCLVFVLGILNWRRKHLRFQLRKNTATLAIVFYIQMVASVNCYSYMKGGRWWLYFAVLSVALNDSSAYVAGRLFGKHHLIGLSPNKTIEGFIGGAIGNIICCWFVASYKLQGDFWQCAPQRFNYGLFEDWKCENGVLPMYQVHEYQLPFSIMGYSVISAKPAVFYTILYAVFASLVAPYVGFLASGFKRAAGIKDFADTLPGHGGVMDRFDCISIMSLFNYFFLINCLLRDQMQFEAAYDATRELQDQEKVLIVNQIAERFGLHSI